MIGYRSINAEIPYKFQILVGCGTRTRVKERGEENCIPNHPSKGSVDEVKSGSGTG